ncbi:DUF262 domain-containing protein [Streptomyces sp. NPDC058773]|uniref:DUF262 domain-containing protein n=1 Tax=Streptomyces sp. NPDC058773 TaxID=3346632 RepID=UPI0036A531B7
MQKLEAHEMPLHKVFSSDYDFRIPDYQRPYAWQEEQAVQLLTDLAEALERGSEEPYFLGSLVLVKESGQPRSDVIDGQQRLTTLTILLSVLRDLTAQAELRDALHKLINQPGDPILGRMPQPRLRHRQRDADFFHKYVQTGGAIDMLLALDRTALATDAQKAVRDNTAALHSELERWSEERRLGLVRMLGERTFLVVVATPDLESAHRIFSVMNSRGLDLSPTDIFKSQIIGALEDPGQSANCARKWEDAEETLGRDDFADLFLHLRMIYEKKRAERELLKEFPKQVLDRYLPDKADVFVNDVVVPYAEAYAQVRDARYEASSGAEQVNAWFKRLQQTDNNDWRPAALWALRNHEHDPEWLDRFFRALERLSASMFIRRVYTTPRVMRYAELLRQLDQGQGLNSPAFELTETEKADTRARLEGELYLVGKIRKYVLLRVDEILSAAHGVKYDLPLITVEHVLPQNPEAGSRWTELFDEDQRGYWTHRLGNLVLLNRVKNSAAQNYAFAAKKSKYFTGRGGAVPFALTSRVLQYEDWTPDVLEAQQKQLVDLLVKEWAL